MMTMGYVPVSQVLEAAKDCTQVLVLGEDPEGHVYMAASTGDNATLVYWIELFKHALLGAYFEGDEEDDR